MQTTEQAAPARGSLIRRFFLGEAASTPLPDIEDAARVPELIDIRPVTEPDIQTVYFRLERLEAGTRLIAETMKRAFTEITSSIESLRAATGEVSTSTSLERIVADAAEPLRASIERLADSVRGFPHVLAAAADHITDRVDLAGAKVEATVAGLGARYPAAPDFGAASGEDPEALGAADPFWSFRLEG